MATGNPEPVEVWAPLFLYYSGDRNKPKFTKEQILDPKNSITFGHCKLCDSPVAGSPDAHMREHRKELSAWLAKQRRAAESRSKTGLKTYRKEQELAAKIEADRIVAGVAAGEEEFDDE